jgi:F0F1-type ATP synthase assembly protein I
MQQVSRMRARDVADMASALALVTQLGFIMFACVLAGLLGGRVLDGWLNTGPWLTIALVLAGVGGGMVAVYRMVMKVVARPRRPGDEPGDDSAPREQD